jgi:site-specific DNA recombinase
MEDMLTTEYGGCGRCLVATRRLSRKADDTSSPTKQAQKGAAQYPRLPRRCCGP